MADVSVEEDLRMGLKSLLSEQDKIDAREGLDLHL
jgi:hypothetical protein